MDFEGGIATEGALCELGIGTRNYIPFGREWRSEAECANQLYQETVYNKRKDKVIKNDRKGKELHR